VHVSDRPLQIGAVVSVYARWAADRRRFDRGVVVGKVENADYEINVTCIRIRSAMRCAAAQTVVSVGRLAITAICGHGSQMGGASSSGRRAVGCSGGGMRQRAQGYQWLGARCSDSPTVGGAASMQRRII